MKIDLFVRILLWLGGLLILVAVVAKLTPLLRTVYYLGTKPGSLLNLGQALLLLAIGIILAQMRKQTQG
ncbi:MAG: hypothetical protein ACP5R4_02330 [Armatimonadota bacterium]